MPTLITEVLIMYLLTRLFLFLTKSPEQLAKERADAFLAEATDLYDLEFRMRKLDRDANFRQPSWMSQH
jgi:hypothetical protein